MTNLTAPFHDHHKHCDNLFADAEAAIAARDWILGGALLQDFSSSLETHFGVEEDALFPAFEAASGIVAGPTRMMRLEHAQMRQLLEQLDEAAKHKDGAAFAGTAETLLIMMQQHNLKEENILYPMCDRTLAAQADSLAPQMQGRLAGTPAPLVPA